MSWSLVQRSPTDCGVSQMCVIMKPRRNEVAQAHIRLSSHRGKKNIYSDISMVFFLGRVGGVKKITKCPSVSRGTLMFLLCGW
jgi:hypothetical protein